MHLKLSDTSVYEPQIRARLGTQAGRREGAQGADPRLEILCRGTLSAKSVETIF